MELRSGRRLSSPPPPHGARRCTRSQRGSGGMDHISALPDDLLLLVLVRLGCARAAAHTSLLSRRWRSLWTRLPEFTFRDVAPGSLEAALARVACPGVSLLDIRVREQHRLDAARVSSLLRAAARLSPEELVFTIPSYLKDRDIDLPCFHRTTSIELEAQCLRFTPPAAGAFPALEKLSLSGCGVDLGTLIPHCPRLRVLRMTNTLFVDDNITVHSASLQELLVLRKWEHHINIVTPVLKQLTLSVYTGEKLNVSIWAPMVEKVSWRCWYGWLNILLGALWHLQCLSLRTVESHDHGLLTNNEEDACLQLPRVHVLSLYIRACVTNILAERIFAQEIEQHLFTNFSILELRLTAMGHVFGPIVLHLLGINRIRTATRRLKIELLRSKMTKACPVNCPCDEPKNWRTQTISLTDIEEVEINGFEGEDHEFDFLKLIFRCVPMLKRMTMKLLGEVTSSNDGCKKIYNIFESYPCVECYIYFSSGSMHSSQSCLST